MSDVSHSIKVVSKQTGLSPHVIRVWERRYGAVEPSRTLTNRRVYSDLEVDRLTLLREATEAGHSIGHVARLATEQLRQLVRQAQFGVNGGSHRAADPDPEIDAEKLLADALQAVRRLDARRLEEVLQTAGLHLGAQGVLLKVAAPLCQRIGDLWQAGEITAAHEHFASALIRVYLGSMCRPFALSDTAPNLVVATPSGQLHELGAVLVSAAAAALGWRVTYLGVSLPAAEIAGVALRGRARAVALSLVYPKDDPNLAAELDTLRRFLPAEIQIIAGGRASSSYAPALDKIHAVRIHGLEQLFELLEDLRNPAPLN
ncbi:MAG: MerR family transcriptional regulator [Limisphaerales bacterium]